MSKGVGQWLQAVVCAIALATAIVVPSAIVGCSSVSTSAAYPVRDAELTVQTSFEAIDAFLQWEAANRGRGAGAEVTAAADRIRTVAPTLYRAAWSAIREHKRLRDTPSRIRMESRVEQLRSLAVDTAPLWIR